MNDSFRLLIDYAAAVSRSLDAPTVLNGALDALLAWPDVDAAWVYLSEPTGDLRLSAVRAKETVAVHAIDMDDVAAVAFGARAPAQAPLPEGHSSGLAALASFPLAESGQPAGTWKEIGVLVLGCRSPLAEQMTTWSSMADLLATALANARQYQQTMRVRDRLATLHKALTHIQRAGSLRDKLQRIANALHNMGWGHVTLWLCDDDGAAGSPTAVSDVVYAGITFQEETRLRRSPPPGLDVYRRPPQELESFRVGAGYLVTATSASVIWQPGDAMYMPLRSSQAGSAGAGPLLGSIELRRPTDGLRPGLDQWELVELFAREAAHEIERVRQGDVQRQQVRDLTVLYEAGAAIFSQREESAILALLNRILCEAAEAPCACFNELDMAHLTLRRLAQYGPSGGEPTRLCPKEIHPLTPDLVEHVIEKRHPFATCLGECRVLYLPVAMGKYILGLAAVCDGRAGRVFTERQTALCRTIANQAASALSHAQLYRHTTVERSRLRAILEASRDGIFLISPGAGVLDLNGMACRLLRLTGEPEDWLDRSVADVVWALRRHAPAAARAVVREIRRIRPGDQSPGHGDFKIEGAVPMFIRYLVYPIQTPDPEGMGWLVLLHDTSEERALARARDDLTHMLVHDLRSPLAAIMSAAALLSGGALGELPHDQYAILDIIQRNSRHLLDLINAILDIAALETNQMPRAPQPVSMALLFDDVIGDLTPLASERQLRLASDLAPDLPLAWADQQMVRRVIYNLVNNAIKFTPAGGQITLTARVEGHRLCLSVVDTGPGIEPDLRDRLFQKFVTGRAEGRGSGLGLAFCKLAVEAHGGRIWVESPAPSVLPGQGPGSAFSFTLPLVAEG